jgi:hypothetical protein
MINYFSCAMIRFAFVFFRQNFLLFFLFGFLCALINSLSVFSVSTRTFCFLLTQDKIYKVVRNTRKVFFSSLQRRHKTPQRDERRKGKLKKFVFCV